MAHTVQNIDINDPDMIWRPLNASADLTTTLTTALLGPVPANTVWIVTSAYVPNIDGAAAVDVTVRHYQADGGGSSRNRYLANTVPAPADGTLIVIDKESLVVMLAGDEIRGGAGVNSDAEILFYGFAISAS